MNAPEHLDDESTLVQVVMASCHQATSHYQSQSCPWSISLYGITKLWVNPYNAEFYQDRYKNIFAFHIISQHLNIARKTRKTLYSVNVMMADSQYHDCWWPGNTRNQGISSKGIDLVCLEYPSFSTKMVNTLRSEIVAVLSFIFLNTNILKTQKDIL